MFNFNNTQLKELKAEFTAAEIYQQPVTWAKTIKQMQSMAEETRAFIARVTSADDYDIILTGAGTSEYVGNALCQALIQTLNGHVRSVGTTDIVASPRLYLSETKPTLLVSFARSGNSPESVGAVEAADKICKNVCHIFITCNERGALAVNAEGRDNVLSIVLTPETHDQSFAMTSSFTNMYLAALLAFKPDCDSSWDELAKATQLYLDAGYKKIYDFVQANDIKRIVYLGTDVLKGIAQESALKVLELTAGNIVALYDTPMGFRHGPKSFVDDDTLCVVYLSDEEATRRYEMDLLAELYRDKKGSKIIAIVNEADAAVEKLCDCMVSLDAGKKLCNAQLALGYITVAQTLGIFASLKLGLTPDNPCPTGEVNRVVKGVTIYEVM